MITRDEILNAKILIVDDQIINNRLLTSILKKEGYRNIQSTSDPMKAIDLYAEIRPDLLVLDLNMPGKNGFQVMEDLKKIEGEDYLPILILSTADSQESRYQALDSGGKDFINKPYDRIEVLIRIRNLLEVRLLHNQSLDQSRTLEQKVSERTKELYDTQKDVIHRLARAVECRDLETGMHIIRMSRYCTVLAQAYGLTQTDCEIISVASPLHDVGKIAIPDNILQKPAKLTEEEWKVMKTHTLVGAQLLSDEKSSFLKIAAEIALNHHERWDGTGYPKGLKKEEIPILGRICCLSDVFDALTNVRPYKKAWTFEEAAAEIRRCGGSYFDPKLVECFLKILPQIRNIHNENKENH